MRGAAHDPVDLGGERQVGERAGADVRRRLHAPRAAARRQRRVQVQTEPRVAAQGARIARGEHDPAAGVVAVLAGAGQQLAADAARLGLGADHEQRQAPDPLAHQRHRAPDHAAPALGHPGAAGVGGEQMVDAHAPRGDRAGRLGRLAEAAAEVLEGLDADVEDRVDVGGLERAD